MFNFRGQRQKKHFGEGGCGKNIVFGLVVWINTQSYQNNEMTEIAEWARIRLWKLLSTTLFFSGGFDSRNSPPTVTSDLEYRYRLVLESIEIKRVVSGIIDFRCPSKDNITSNSIDVTQFLYYRKYLREIL